VKYRGLLNEVKKLRAQLVPSAGVRIVITGGLPADYRPAPAPPPGSDLHKQAEIFARDKRPAKGSPEAAGASASEPAPEVTPKPRTRLRGA
jgi:hypothetical protein